MNLQPLSRTLKDGRVRRLQGMGREFQYIGPQSHGVCACRVLNSQLTAIEALTAAGYAIHSATVFNPPALGVQFENLTYSLQKSISYLNEHLNRKRRINMT